MKPCRQSTSTSCLLFVFVLRMACLRDAVQGVGIIREPLNTASRLGDSSVLHCTVDRGGDAIYWNFFPNGTGTGKRLYTYDGVEEIKPDPNYDVDSSLIHQGIFDLIVRETSVASAGIYQCSLFMAAIDAEARFVSVSPVTCDPPPGEKEILEGATVILTCDVSYTGYKPPTLTWWQTDSSAPLQGEWLWNYERSTFFANVTAVPDLDMVEFTCDLNFDNEPGDPGAPPVYNDTCRTHFMVLHGATRITIVPDPDGVVNVEVDDTVNCSASGRPLPTFSWEGADGEIFLGNVLRVLPEWSEQQKTFTCYARNELNGQPHEASLEIELYVTNPDPQPQEPNEAAIEPWIIAVAVVIPVVVLSAAGGGAYAYVKHQKKKINHRGVAKNYSGPNLPPGFGMSNGQKPPGANGPKYYQAFLQNTAIIGGMRVPVPPPSDTGQNRRLGRDSPGYGDLGVKHFPSTNSGLNSSVDTNYEQGFLGKDKPPVTSPRSSLGPATSDYQQRQVSSLPVNDNPYDVISDNALADRPQEYEQRRQQQQQQQQQQMLYLNNRSRVVNGVPDISV